jgi:hypothetical protein
MRFSEPLAPELNRQIEEVNRDLTAQLSHGGAASGAAPAAETAHEIPAEPVAGSAPAAQKTGEPDA